MNNSYYSVEKKVDMELKNKRTQEEVKIIEEKIKGLTEDPFENGLTVEQMFLVRYYGLDEQEILNNNFNIDNDSKVVYDESNIPREKLEVIRYNELIDMHSILEEFNGEKINKYNDCFHSDIKSWDDYTRDFEQDPLIVKKMRNLQMLNQMAHKYETLFRTILYGKIPQINEEYVDEDRKKLECDIYDMFSSLDSDVEVSTQRLTQKLGAENVKKIKNNKAIRYCIKASIWMFKQKNKYLLDIFEDLQKTSDRYNYGIIKDALYFDVPGYGQFSIHLGRNGLEKIENLRILYGLNNYKGEYLGKVYILSKADPELLNNANYEELSELDKQRYRIATQNVKEQQTEKNIEENSTKKSKDTKKMKETEKFSLESLIESSKDKEKARKIIEIIIDAGIEPEKVVTRTLLDKGNPDAIKDVIEIISQNDYGIGLDILTRCKTLLSVGQENAIDLMVKIDKLNKLGIDLSIIDESPNFLTVSKSDKMEPIYNVLKQYKIDLTNHNVATAFESSAQNIKSNMDLVIENGLYDFAKVGVNKFFTCNNKNLNMRINLLKKYNTPLVTTDKENKRRISATLFRKKKDLMELYGITQEQILEELSRVKGQDLIKNDNKYYFEDFDEQIALNDKQKEISNNIYSKLDGNHLEEDLVIKIGDYFYSAIKVKEQIDSIIANFNIQDLEKEDVSEILKMALFKNKNIDQEEVDKVSEQIQALMKKETKQEEVSEEINGQSKNEHEETQQLEENASEIPIYPDSEVEDYESQEEPKKEDSEYAEIRGMTSDIIDKQQNIENIEQIISKLKQTKKVLKQQIKEMEEKINNSILENEEPTAEIIEDIKKMQRLVSLQREKRKEVKQMIKRYKENKKTMKAELKNEKEARNSVIDDLEL